MKAAVFFPGIGYRFERPLLKGAMDLAHDKGYSIITVGYDGFAGDAKQNLDVAVERAMNQTEKILSPIDWTCYEKILFVGKSIGTAAAAIYSSRNNLFCKKILLTPIPQTFSVDIENALAFYGNADPWISLEQVTDGCRKNSIPLSVYENANHSLISGDEGTDMRTLRDVMKKISDFID